MAKNNVQIVGIVAVVGLMVLIFAVGGGFFKNFSTQDIGGASPTPTATHVPTDSPGLPTLWQQIQNIFTNLWNQLQSWLVSTFGFKI